MKHALAIAALAACAALLGACVSSGPATKTSAPTKAAQDNLRLGVAYLQRGDLKSAKEKLERAEKWDPRNAEVQTALGVLNERIGDAKAAESHYRDSVRLAPKNAEISNNFAAFLCRSGKHDEGIKRFEAAAADQLYSTPWAALTNAGVCQLSAKRPGDARRSFERALQQRPNFVDAAMQLADLNLQQNRPQDAVKLVEDQLTMSRGSPELLLAGWRAARMMGDARQTEDYARRLRRDFPQSAQARSLTQLSQQP